MASMQPTDVRLSTYSELAHGVPLKDRLRIPDNEPACPLGLDLPTPVDPALNPPDHQEGYIPIDTDAIDPLLHEVPQKPYQGGLQNEVPAEYISYGPGGFTVANVFGGDLSEVIDAIGPIPMVEGRSWPDKTAFHFEFSDAAYNTRVHLAQRRVPRTRGAFATLAAEEAMKMLDRLSQFPYTSGQIKVVGIYVRSRGTVQARLFVAAEALDAQAQA